MSDETRKALDEIFISSKKIKPLGASAVYRASGGSLGEYVGLFQVHGNTLNKLRQLYDDAIAADDAAKLDAQRNRDNKFGKGDE
ncbi:hypothetical protein LCGC14_0425560 [marine sediment metagenome]|uniref:Uncharacterized protein n=1 Tax=marine sediment metagenome TaxID=412755 RepID=A0A0F9SVP8_9ZZZZ